MMHVDSPGSTAADVEPSPISSLWTGEMAALAHLPDTDMADAAPWTSGNFLKKEGLIETCECSLRGSLGHVSILNPKP
eukprot:365733-Chlamydomonas_euryale.AAC.4